MAFLVGVFVFLLALVLMRDVFPSLYKLIVYLIQISVTLSFVAAIVGIIFSSLFSEKKSDNFNRSTIYENKVAITKKEDYQNEDQKDFSRKQGQDQNQKQKQKDVLKSKLNPEPNYTGIIIDCRGLNLEATCVPLIYLSDNRLVYSPASNFSSIKYNYISYCKTVDQAIRTQKVGTKPIVIKASYAQGRKIVLPVEATKWILKFASNIKQGRLVILL